MIQITKEFNFEGAHALKGYDGKCSHIHGHSYKMFVTVYGEPISDKDSPKNGMIIDFSDLKRIVNQTVINKFDHALVLNNSAPLAEQINREYGNVVMVDFTPTCENLVKHFAELIEERLPSEIVLKSVKLYETATSFSEWIKQ